MEESKIVEKGLYQLTPLPEETYPYHCKHNLLVASKTMDDKWIFKDTYWGYQPTTYKFNEIKDRITLVFDLNYAKQVTESEYNQYDPENRFFIPMGGNSERYLIDTRAKKSREIIIELIKNKIQRSKSTISFEQRNIKRLTKTLDDVEQGCNIENIHI